MRINVVHFVRRSKESAFSIERVYETVRSGISKQFHVSVWTCLEFSDGVLPRIRDMFRARRHQSDVNHITGDVHYLTFLLHKRRTVLTIHDLGLLERLRGPKWLIAWFFWYWLPVWRSQIVITISETTRRALIASIRCSPQKIRVVHNAVSSDFIPSKKTTFPAIPRILHVGTGENKNLLRVAKALQGVKAILVVIGIMSEQQRATLAKYNIAHENLHSLTPSEIVNQYVQADIVIFASTYEGFGLPIIEAQTVGRPVITSAIEPMMEVAGDGACFVDPYSIESIRLGFEKIISDEEYRLQIVEKGILNAKRFRPEVIVKQYESIYHEIRLFEPE